jgi:hypothetical protein
MTLLAALLLAADALVLKAGTPVPLVTVGEVSTKTHRQGDRFDLEVSRDVTVGEHLVIPKGTRGLAEIARHRARGPFGKAGMLEVRLLHVTVAGRNIRLDGEAEHKGASAAVPAIATGVITAAFGAIILGRSARIPAGTPLTGYTHRDLPLVTQP